MKRRPALRALGVLAVGDAPGAGSKIALTTVPVDALKGRWNIVRELRIAAPSKPPASRVTAGRRKGGREKKRKRILKSSGKEIQGRETDLRPMLSARWPRARSEGAGGDEDAGEAE